MKWEMRCALVKESFVAAVCGGNRRAKQPRGAERGGNHAVFEAAGRLSSGNV